MAITQAQRQQAIGLVVTAAVTNPATLQQLLPGSTPATVLAAIAAAVGSTQDANLTTVLANQVALLNQQLVGAQQSVASIEAEVAAATVA